MSRYYREVGGSYNPSNSCELLAMTIVSSTTQVFPCQIPEYSPAQNAGNSSPHGASSSKSPVPSLFKQVHDPPRPPDLAGARRCVGTVPYVFPEHFTGDGSLS
jgi:hypothetical protein